MDVFNLKSLYLDDSVVRGDRINIKNNSSTKSIKINPEDESKVKTGETGVEKEYLIQSSLVGNDLAGYGTFYNNSEIIFNYTGTNDITFGDKIRINDERKYYTVTGINIDEHKVYLSERYLKESLENPDRKDSLFFIRKVSLDSVKYEKADSNIIYDENKGYWGVTGGQFQGPYIASSQILKLDDNINIQFQKSEDKDSPDLSTILSVQKTLISNNKVPIYDIALDPIPYPHSSLQVFISKNNENLKKAIEFEDYVVNYSSNPDLLYPYPPFEERNSAYLKFLDKIHEEEQLKINESFNGNLELIKKEKVDNVEIDKPVRDILENESFEITVDSDKKLKNKNFLLNAKAGTVSFIEHVNRECIINNIAYYKKLFWDGLSVVKGVKEEQVKNVSNLIIDGIEGIEGIDYKVYFEDTEENNLIRDEHFVIDPESGAFKLNFVPKKDEIFLVSYYVEGEDIKNEKIDLTKLRLKCYPVMVGSVVINSKFSYISENGKIEYKNKILIEGIDYKISYITGNIELFSKNTIVEITVSYTPLALIHCIIKGIEKSNSYQITIVDDVITYTGKETGYFSFKVNNPVVSVPQKNIETIKDKNYSFINPLSTEKIKYIKIRENSNYLNLSDIKYDNLTKEIVLNSVTNNNISIEGKTIVATYTFESETLPYAPIILLESVLNKGDDYFIIEGYDKRDILRPDQVIRIDNPDPLISYYFIVKEVLFYRNSTVVKLKDIIPQNIVNPSFYLIDSVVKWNNLPESVIVDNTISIGTNKIILKNNPLFIKHNIKKNSLLLINDNNVYNVLSVETTDTDTLIEITPNLDIVINNIKFSEKPIYTEGDTTLFPSKFLIEGNNQPAFTLFYNPPYGYEGNAKILFFGGKIVIEEYIKGIKNLKNYEFELKNYDTIESLIEAIVTTKSTFSGDIFGTEIADYYPFAIINNNIKEYYLKEGYWSTELLVSEEFDFKNLPYTFKIKHLIEKSNLINLKEGDNEIVIKNQDLTNYIQQEDVLLLIDENYRFSITKVEKVTYDSLNTVIKLFEGIQETLSNVKIYKSIVAWKPLQPNLLDIDYKNSELIFSGKITVNIRKNTLLSIENKSIYIVKEVKEEEENFKVKIAPLINNSIRVQNYFGYIKYSAVPIEVDSLFENVPYFYISYNAPGNVFGNAQIKINNDVLIINETLNNINTKENVYLIKNENKIKDLFSFIENISSPSNNTDKSCEVYYNLQVKEILNTNFGLYSIEDIREFEKLPKRIDFVTNLFDITYSSPVGYEGFFNVEFNNSNIIIEEVVLIGSKEQSKKTIINYKELNNIYEIVNIIIPSITSIVSDSIHPFLAELKNTEQLYNSGSMDGIEVVKVIGKERKSIYTKVNYFVPIRIEIPFEKLQLEKDYTIINGYIELNNSIKAYERYFVSYMGLNPLVEYEGKNIYCSCKYLSYLPPNSKVSVFYEFLNIDQFYIQKLTERRFLEIVVYPQIKELLAQKNSTGSLTELSVENNANYIKGIADIFYLLRDEYIKKQLFLRIYKWYKNRLRALSAELKLILGFKFAHSNSIGIKDNYYSLDDVYIENDNDYTLTKDLEIEKASEGHSKFFPVGYEGQSPLYYNRFGKEYLSFNEVFCCNVKYKNEKNEIVTIGIIKSEKPYWNRSSDLDFKIIDDQNVVKNLVGYYLVDIPEEERLFSHKYYSFLKNIDVEDEVKIEGTKDYYEISEIRSPQNKSYEYLFLLKSFTNKAIRIFDISNKDISFDSFIDELPTDGYRIWIKRKNKETFPMFDDYGSLGATAYGYKIKEHIEGTRRIKKSSLLGILKLLFPIAEALDIPKNFKILVKKDSNKDWESIGSIDLSKLTFKEECNVDDVLDALRYDFTEKYIVPTTPPYTVYDIKRAENKGFHRYFYISFENIYDPNSTNGYYQGIVFRAKDRKWWFKIVDDGQLPVVEDYGFKNSLEYKNFYDPDNLYLHLILEKQSWLVMYLINRDLYDYSNKMFRAFERDKINVKNSRFQSFLIKISENICNIITRYEKILRFLLDKEGPLYKILYPDSVHEEKDSSLEITQTFNNTLSTLKLYEAFYNKTVFLYNLLIDLLDDWKRDYIRWALSIQQGVIPQKLAVNSLANNNGVIEIGPIEIPTLELKLLTQVKDSKISLLSDYFGKYLQIDVKFINDDTERFIFYLYSRKTMSSLPVVIYKTINEFCDEVSTFRYKGEKIFDATNVYSYFENNVTINMINVIDKKIEDGKIILYSLNVQDHRPYDSRILFLNGKIEDKLYLGFSLNVQAIELKYLGSYYKLKFGIKGLDIRVNSYSDVKNVKYGVFLDEIGYKILVLSYVEEENLKYEKFLLYKVTNDVVQYKTLDEISEEINESSKVFTAFAPYSVYKTSCEYFFVTPDFVDFDNYSGTVYISTNLSYVNISRELDQFYYRIYNDPEGKKLDIAFYELVIDVRNSYKKDTFADVFTFNLQKKDGTYKTISELCAEINNFRYKGEKILEASVIYNKEPYEKLSTFLLVYNNYKAVGYSWAAKIDADGYIEAIFGKNASKRTLDDIKNAMFVFPIYTANGNPNKLAIDGIPVSGKWLIEESKEVVELECLDGTSWAVSFSDFEEEGYRSIVELEEIINRIDSEGIITEDMFEKIKSQGDEKRDIILKELILKRFDGATETILKYDLRKYNTLNKLIEAIENTRVNDEGKEDINGNRKLFTANLIGTKEIEGNYKSIELKATFTPIIKSFVVSKKDGTTEYKSNFFIGWKIDEKKLPINFKYKLKMIDKEYSHGNFCKFVVDSPEIAYTNTYYNIPQSFRKDIKAFDIYSWDDNASYEIRDNWIYFKSNNVDYDENISTGQPLKELGYGIPLAGSGKVPENESLINLINRINSHPKVSRFFYANLKFTREEENTGYFEYGYLPNVRREIPKSKLDDIYLKDQEIFILKHSPNYEITNSNVTINNGQLSLATSYNFYYSYEKVFFFNDISNRFLSGLAANINSDYAPQISNPLIEASVVSGLENVLTKKLIPTFVEKTLTDSYSSLEINIGTSKTTALRIRVRNLLGTNFEIKSAKFIIPKTRDKLIIKCDIVYKSTYNLVNYNLNNISFDSLVNFVSSIKPYPDDIFPSLYEASLLFDSYKNFEAVRLLPCSVSIPEGGVKLGVKLEDIVAFKVLNMHTKGTLIVDNNDVTLITHKIYNEKLRNHDLGKILDILKGDYKNGFISCDVVPLKSSLVLNGLLKDGIYSLSTNTSAPVYFGILGDIKFVQISDYNLYKLYNYVKDRLGKPWEGEEDYYTSEKYNINNPISLNMNNFLGFIKYTRYNQIKESIVDENIIFNKYLWLYLKLHKEFGCDQRIKILKEKIEKDKNDTEMLSQL